MWASPAFVCLLIFVLTDGDFAFMYSAERGFIRKLLECNILEHLFLSPVCLKQICCPAVSGFGEWEYQHVPDKGTHPLDRVRSPPRRHLQE